MVQNYHRDAAGHLRWRTSETEGGPGLPPSSRAIVSPYDTSVRYARHGHIIRWKGFAAHLTETCASEVPDAITDLATTASTTHVGSCPASMPACHAAGCCPPSTWSTPATPFCLIWNKPPVNTRSPLRAAEEQPYAPAPPRRGLRPGRLPYRFRPSAADLSPGAGQRGLAPPLLDLLAHRGLADRGQVHQEPVPPLPVSRPVHQHRRQCPHLGFPRASSATCNSASAPSSRRSRVFRRLPSSLPITFWCPATGRPASRTYYDKKISQGKHHTQALLCLARRRADVLFAMLRDGTFYDPQPAPSA